MEILSPIMFFLVWLVTWSLEITISQLIRTQDNKLFPQGNTSPWQSVQDVFRLLPYDSCDTFKKYL